LKNRYKTAFWHTLTIFLLEILESFSFKEGFVNHTILKGLGVIAINQFCYSHLPNNSSLMNRPVRAL